MAAEEGHRDQRDGLDAAAPLLSAAASDSEALGAHREDATTVNNEDADDTAAQNETQWQKFRGFCDRNIGLVFVLFAQMFASIVRNPLTSSCSVIQERIPTDHILLFVDGHDYTSPGDWLRYKVPRLAGHLRAYDRHGHHQLSVHAVEENPRLPSWPPRGPRAACASGPCGIGWPFRPLLSVVIPSWELMCIGDLQ
jgi:hypothetical protein